MVNLIHYTCGLRAGNGRIRGISRMLFKADIDDQEDLALNSAYFSRKNEDMAFPGIPWGAFNCVMLKFR